MSPSQENYLKNIFELQQSAQKVTNKKLANMMQVSAPSVTEMLLTLSQNGYIEHTPYNSIELTDTGQQLAEKLVQKHRLWEVFLANKLHYAITDVHPEADALEHSTDERLVQALNHYLDYPQKCPHGGIIPGNGQGESDDDDLILAETIPPMQVKIVRILDNHEFLAYFSGLGLELNQIVTVKKRSSFDNSVLVETKEHKHISLSHEAATYIFVEQC
ncbi:metal-dependent transcriptional regulator [Bombilactobacillus folatiphilus]|uniref:Manganese transport regulator n=1 Tax=Bombilactobacillus folatiphilus TaxID=2923362 RepID=A0ABY4P885_9LACO|nr:metal-dependent transcriptional regulator [Bombilactobacillus folatiphilus]UQS81920.1 metal-dependent transcriptional regulator [Bombilactobacillus folatiphilus]